jgi:hypothetical protein
MELTQGLQGFNCRDTPCKIFGLNLFSIIPQECRCCYYYSSTNSGSSNNSIIIISKSGSSGGGGSSSRAVLLSARSFFTVEMCASSCNAQ